MIKTQLYFDVEDTEYFKWFRQYLLANYHMYFEVIEEYSRDTGVCIVSDYINKRNNRGVFIIKEEKGDVQKYSRASKICAELMKFNNLGAEKQLEQGRPGPLITGVTSAAGGVGKSVVSQAISCSFAQKGKKVLYINPDPFSTFEEIFKDTDKNAWTQLRYYIRKKDGDISTRIRSLAGRSGGRRVDYIVNCSPSADGFISEGESAWLMNQLNESRAYDAIVFDIPSYPGNGHIEILKRADAKFIVYSRESDERHLNFRRYLEKQGVAGIIDVANFTQTGEFHIPEAEDIFQSHPMAFWKAIDGLCKTAGEKHEISN